MILKEIRQIIRENVFAAAVPDFVMIQALDRTTDELKQALDKYIQMYRSHSDEERLQAESAADDMLAAFKKDVRQAFHDRLDDFLREIG